MYNNHGQFFLELLLDLYQNKKPGNTDQYNI